MGTVPPRPLPPDTPPAVRGNDLETMLAQWDVPVEVGGYMQTDGGRISVDDMTPIWQIGKPEPTGYIDKSGNFYLIDQNEPRSGQYEDAVVDYEEC